MTTTNFSNFTNWLRTENELISNFSNRNRKRFLAAPKIDFVHSCRDSADSKQASSALAAPRIRLIRCIYDA